MIPTIYFFKLITLSLIITLGEIFFKLVGPNEHCSQVSVCVCVSLSFIGRANKAQHSWGGEGPRTKPKKKKPTTTKRKIQNLRFSTIKTRAKFFDWKKKKFTDNPRFFSTSKTRFIVENLSKP
jgi:hypothetical protein